MPFYTTTPRIGSRAARFARRGTENTEVVPEKSTPSSSLSFADGPTPHGIRGGQERLHILSASKPETAFTPGARAWPTTAGRVVALPRNRGTGLSLAPTHTYSPSFSLISFSSARILSMLAS